MLVGLTWQWCSSAGNDGVRHRRLAAVDDPLYQLLLWVKDYILLVLGIVPLLVRMDWLITYYYFRKPLAVFKRAHRCIGKQLAQPRDEIVRH